MNHLTLTAASRTPAYTEAASLLMPRTISISQSQHGITVSRGGQMESEPGSEPELESWSWSHLYWKQSKSSVFKKSKSSMAAPQKNIIDHFTHPGHPLTAVDGHKQQYLCNGCKTPGSGKRYRCNGCDFDLHEYCGTCPDTLSTFMHQNHTRLALVTPTGNIARHVNRFCSVCTDPVDGLFYRCLECDFDAHPLCTQFPEKLKHALDKIHHLNLESSPVAGICAVCKCLCSGWRYRCEVWGLSF